MAQEREERKLAAILATDMVGYSRLTEADERGTIARQKRHRRELIDPLIASHNGRIVKTTGDGLLVEFASVVDATECAVAFQLAMVEREQDLPNDRRIQYRIGINLGDIIIEGKDILGEGVNVAVRLEGLAEAGGVVISGIVYEIVRSKVDFGFEDLGMQKVKNLVEPIRAFRIVPRDSSGIQVSPQLPATGRSLSEKPSIAVLPFANPNRDPEQEYFADGITEDLITDLSKVSGLFVIGRNSSFAFKGRTHDTKEIARQLGVQHILEGSVRRSGDRIRINAQLVEAETRGQLWAERFDGDLSDIFSLQDDINEKIVTSLKTHLVPLEVGTSLRQSTQNPKAYDLFLRGRSEYYLYTQSHMANARKYFEQAIEKDPCYAEAYAFLSHCLTTAYVFAWCGADDNLNAAVALAEKSIALDENSALGHARLGWIQGYLDQFDEAIANFERAIVIEPRSAEAYYTYGETMNKRGDPERGLPLLERAFSIDSIVPPSWDFARGHSLVLMRRFENASSLFETVVKRAPQFLPAWVQLARTYSEQDRLEDARETVRIVQELAPQFSLGHAKRMFPYQFKMQARRLECALCAASMTK